MVHESKDAEDSKEERSSNVELYATYPFMIAFIDRAIGMEVNSPIKRVRLMYAELILSVGKSGRDWTSWKGHVSNLRRNITKFMKLVSEFMDVHCEIGLCSLRFQLSNPSAENVRRFEALGR